ncbi:MAG: hypothetical protein U0903_15640 [Planctomycetales bacterium]
MIRFQPLVAQNVAEVTWHKTQEIVWNKDGTIDYHVDRRGRTKWRGGSWDTGTRRRYWNR